MTNWELKLFLEGSNLLILHENHVLPERLGLLISTLAVKNGMHVSNFD